MELGRLACNSSSDRNSKRGFLGRWYLGVISGPVGAKAERRRGGRVQRPAWLEGQHVGEDWEGQERRTECTSLGLI